MVRDLVTNLSEYSAWTETMAVYPSDDSTKARNYVILGLISELGEVCGMLKREIRDPDYTLERLNLKLELGDVLWYLARLHYDHTPDTHDDSEPKASKVLADHLGIMLDSYNCLEVSMAIFKHFKDIAQSRTHVTSYILGKSVREITSFRELLNLVTDIHENSSEAFDLSACTLIAIHEMYSMPVVKLITIILDNMDGLVGLIAFYILCDRNRFDPYEVMKANFGKLEDLKERGKIHGTGSDR